MEQFAYSMLNYHIILILFNDEPIEAKRHKWLIQRQPAIKKYIEDSESVMSRSKVYAFQTRV
jgi:hypothetical protein